MLSALMLLFLFFFSCSVVSSIKGSRIDVFGGGITAVENSFCQISGVRTKITSPVSVLPNADLVFSGDSFFEISAKVVISELAHLLINNAATVLFQNSFVLSDSILSLFEVNGMLREYFSNVTCFLLILVRFFTLGWC